MGWVDRWVDFPVCVAHGVSDQEGILIIPFVSLHYTESNNHILKRQCICVLFMIPFLRNWGICLKFEVLDFSLVGTFLHFYGYSIKRMIHRLYS